MMEAELALRASFISAALKSQQLDYRLKTIGSMLDSSNNDTTEAVFGNFDEDFEESGLEWLSSELGYDINLRIELGSLHFGYTQSILRTHLDDAVMHGFMLGVNF